jgi:hypothetical protein
MRFDENLGRPKLLTSLLTLPCKGVRLTYAIVEAGLWIDALETGYQASECSASFGLVTVVEVVSGSVFFL